MDVVVFHVVITGLSKERIRGTSPRTLTSHSMMVEAIVIRRVNQ